jgi:release factor glutamine methyltransferase
MRPAVPRTSITLRVTQSVSIASALAQCGLAAVDAQVLLSHVVGHNRAWLVAHAHDELAVHQAIAFFALAKRRRNGEPVAYLTGIREFWGLPLRVSPAVLIPRPETETLVEVALAHLPADRPCRVLDLGTGCGAVALALARERPDSTVVATDISVAALGLARENAHHLSITNVQWLQSDWYAQLPHDAGVFDVIVSNPPYVNAGDAHMRVGDLRYEPVHALTPGNDGLEALRRIVFDGVTRLQPAGCLAVEHGFDQAAAVRGLFDMAEFRNVRTACDIAGIPRVSYARAAGSSAADAYTAGPAVSS